MISNHNLNSNFEMLKSGGEFETYKFHSPETECASRAFLIYPYLTFHTVYDGAPYSIIWST